MAVTRNLNTVTLKPSDGAHHEEAVTSAIVYPGEAIRLQADGTVAPETLSAVNAALRGLKIAKEQGFPDDYSASGSTNRGKVTDPYASGAVCFYYSPLPGDIINARVKIGEDISIGDYLSVEGSGSGKFVEVASSSSASYPIRFEDLKAPTALATNLGTTGTSTILGLITGTVGTNAPTIQTADQKASTVTPKAIFEYVIPASYRAGSAITVRANAGMKTTVSDTTATLTVEAFKDNGDGTVAANIGPVAQSINSLVASDKDFVITPTGLVAGDKLVVRLTISIQDAATGTAVIGVINKLSVRVGDGIAGQLEALESSGGALAATGVIRCRVL